MKLFVVEPLATGGMIHYAYQLCTALAQAGADVTLVTSESYELTDWSHNFKVERRIKWWTLYDNQSPGKVPTGGLKKIWHKVRWTVRRGWRGLSLVREWLRLTRYLLAEKPDVVQFGKINFPFEAFFLAWLKRRGLFLTDVCHEFELRERGNTLMVNLVNRLYASVYDQFGLVLLHGESNQRRFLSIFSVPEARTAVIPHGNETMFNEQHGGELATNRLKAQYGLEASDDPIVLFFGNLTPSKGLPDLLHAFAQLRDQTAAKLIIAGYPSKFIDLPALKQTAVTLNIADSVIFDTRYLPIEEIGPLIEMATVVAFPYLNSSQSGALQVAYAFGRPVVATEVGGLPDVVENGRSGLLVPVQNPEALGAALFKLISDPILAQEMGDYARHLSQTKFAWEPISELVVSYYQEKLGGEGAFSAGNAD